MVKVPNQLMRSVYTKKVVRYHVHHIWYASCTEFYNLMIYQDKKNDTVWMLFYSLYNQDLSSFKKILNGKIA